MRTPLSTRRAGFSLIELMVAMALSLFVMVILTQAFVTSIDTFATLKSIGEMQGKLRTVTSILQADLMADHFEGKRRLSNLDLQILPPNRGFFVVYQATAPDPDPTMSAYVDEGSEAAGGLVGLKSWRAANHVLYFTVKLRGNRQEDYFSAVVPPGPLLTANTNFFGQGLDGLYQNAPLFSSQWAEVCYFLVPTGTTDDPANPAASGTPLFALYRSQYLLVPNPLGIAIANWPTPAASANPYANVSSHVDAGGNLVFHAPDDVAVNQVQSPMTRALLMMPNGPPVRQPNVEVDLAGAPPSGSTLVLANVSSFQVQVYRPQFNVANPPPEFHNVDPTDTTFPATYDTAGPAPYSIQALKVTIRVFDSKSRLSRQVTLIQDM